MATSYYFWGHQRVGLLRVREKMVYLCMPLFLPYFLFFLPLFFFLSVLFLLLISNYYLLVGCFPFGLFFSWIPLSRCLLLSCHELFLIWSFLFLGLSLGDSLFLSASLQCFPLHWVHLFYHGYLFLLYRTNLMGFLPFTPRVSPTVFGLFWASL